MKRPDVILNSTTNRLYDYLVDEEDVRVCKDIPEESCDYVPGNFFTQIFASTLSKLGDEISNPKTTLAWLFSFVQAPLFLVGFLVPIRESGSMLPQIMIAALVRRQQVRKWVWVIGSLLQGIAMAGMALTAYSLSGVVAGWTLIALLVLFSLARGLCSVASKDVLGKTIPKTRRGRLGGFATSISGLLAICVGLFMLMRQGDTNSQLFYTQLLLLASGLWLIAAVVYSQIREKPGATSGGNNAIEEAIDNLGLLKRDPPFRYFVIVRSLFLCSALTAPYYVVLATRNTDAKLSTLGLFIVANGLASSLSAPFWGRLADRSSRTVMIRAALLSAVLGILMFVLVTFVPTVAQQIWIYPLALFILGIAHSGVRLGRKTYIVDMAGGNKRTDYVAVSNTVIGVILLLTGFVGALAQVVSTTGVILILSLFGIAGVLLAQKLPEVQT